MTFLAPQFLWALLALPAVILLHFLRTRRRSRIVSALFLWRRAREAADSRRRFSPTWLLLLQLLFAALAALALARPVFSFQGPPDRVIVIDSSASMAAVDGDGVRLDRAREIAEALLDGSGRVALIRAGLDAEVVAPLSAEHAVTRSALRALEAGDRDGDLTRALELAQAIAPEGEVHLISDSEPPQGNFSYHSVAADAINYGITTFDTGVTQVYLAVSSNDPRPQQLVLELRRDGRELARSTLLVPARGQASVTFPLDQASGFLEARLQVPAYDALALDDVAYSGQRELEVAVGEESGPVLRALQALPGVRVRLTSNAAALSSDAHVLFGHDPSDLPAGNVLLFAAASEDPTFRSIRDWDQGDELLRFVDLRETVVGLAPELETDGRPEEPPVEEAPVEGVVTDEVRDEPGARWETLARAGDLTPVISRRSSDGNVTVRVAFHPSQTDMVFRPAFPTFIANVMSEFRGEAAVPLGARLSGATLEGQPVERALRPGVYRTAVGPVAASLLSAAETRLPVASSVSDRRAPGTDQGATEVTRALWLFLVVTAGALLLLEWLAWSRGGAGWLRSN